MVGYARAGKGGSAIGLEIRRERGNGGGRRENRSRNSDLA